jgi:hypothetical protein
MVGRNNGCDLIVDLMRRHAADIDIFHNFVLVVAALTFSNNRNRDMFTNLGYIELCVEHLNLHSSDGKNERKVTNACISMSNIVLSNLAKQRARTVSGLVPLLTTISEQYAGHQETVKWSKELLSRIG